MYDETAIDFLKNIWHSDQGIGYLWLVPGKTTHSININTENGLNLLEALLDSHIDEKNIYFSVNQQEFALEKNSRGSANSFSIGCLYADFDQVDDWTDLNFELSPSYIVKSGGGYHCYWIFKQAQATSEELAALQRTWVEYLGADETVFDLNRVLRLPGSFNRKEKYPSPLLCEIVHQTPQKYGLDDFKTVLEYYDPKWVEKRKQTPISTPTAKNTIIERFNSENGVDYIIEAYGLERDGDNRLRKPNGDSDIQIMQDGIHILCHAGQHELYNNGNPTSPFDVYMKINNLSFNEALQSITPEIEADTTSQNEYELWLAEGDIMSDKHLFAIKAISDAHKITTNKLDGDILFDGLSLQDSDYYSEYTRVNGLWRRLFGKGRISKVGIEDAIHTLASWNIQNPLKEYLEQCFIAWDGTDTIDKVTACFVDEQNNSARYIKMWAVGAVRRVLDNGHQNRMLVLVGGQGLGKSEWAQWLVSGCKIQGIYDDSSIDPGNKEHERQLTSTWIWESAEFRQVTSKKDREALKAFITKREAKFRIPFAKRAITKAPISSFIATDNELEGILNDSTGNRRFLPLDIKLIDWSYKQVDVNQFWATAMQLYLSGYSTKFTPEELEAHTAYTKDISYRNPLCEVLETIIEASDDPLDRLTNAQIEDEIMLTGYKSNGSRSLRLDIVKSMEQLGYGKTKPVKENGKLIRAFTNVRTAGIKIK